MLNSINTNIAAGKAQANIGIASDHASASISRLSSGERIVRASDDVAGLSIGTSLRTNVNTLKRALINTAQGSSLLQVADGALAQVTDILQRMKAISVQASAGSLTDTERGFLDQEFQNLTQEIDRLASQTNFNGVTLLDGTEFDATYIETKDERSTQASAVLVFNAAPADQETILLNGITVEIDDANDGANSGGAVLVNTSQIVGGTAQEYVEAIANALNATTNPSLSSVKYSARGTGLEIIARAGGRTAEQFTIDQGNSTAAYTIQARATNEPAAPPASTFFTLQGSDEFGLAAGDTIGRGPFGAIGDRILANHTQNVSQDVIDFRDTTFAQFADGQTLTVDDGNTVGGGNPVFELDNDGALGGGTIQVDISSATTKHEVLDAIVAAFNTYTGEQFGGTLEYDDYVIRHLEARRNGDELIFETRDTVDIVNNIDKVSAITPPISTTVPNAVLQTSGIFDSANDQGISTNGVANKDFIGEVQGFEVTYTGIDNQINISLTVGDYTYGVSNVSTGTDARLRLISDKDDFFDIDFQGGTQNITVENQKDADFLAIRLDKAFRSVTFYQDRDVTSFKGARDVYANGEVIGSLTDSTFSLNSSNFDGMTISDIRVFSPLDGQNYGILEFDINGSTFRSDEGIGVTMGQFGHFHFANIDNPLEVLTLHTNSINKTRTDGTTLNAIEFDSEEKAAALRSALIDAFGIGKSRQTLDFQVGVTTSDTLDVYVGNITTKTLFDEEKLNVLTQDTAAHASDMLDAAIDKVTSVRAEVGSLQSRFGFATANIESSIQNQDAARGVLLDTDVASESTAFAQETVKLQAGVSVLAQANQITSELLALIQQ